MLPRRSGSYNRRIYRFSNLKDFNYKKRSYKMSEMEIIKHDVLKLINKVEELEQMIINLTYKRKEEEK